MSKDTVRRNCNAVSRLTRTVMWTAYKATAVFSVWLWQLYGRLTKQLCCSRSDCDRHIDGLQSNCGVLGLTVTVIRTAYKATVLFSVWLWQIYRRLTKQLWCSWSDCELYGWLTKQQCFSWSDYDSYNYGRLTKQLCCSRSEYDSYMDGLQSNCNC